VVNGPTGGFGQWIVPVSIELHTTWLVKAVRGGKVNTLGGTTKDGRAVQQVCTCQPNATLFAAEDSEGQVTMTSNWREQQG
jgi:hypothetical protein